VYRSIPARWQRAATFFVEFLIVTVFKLLSNPVNFVKANQSVREPAPLTNHGSRRAKPSAETASFAEIPLTSNVGMNSWGRSRERSWTK
jgi:hypothetical protein